MLNFDVKRKINTLRDILVGKVPDPKAQVEQITIALIYKFMDDMDMDSVAFGGNREFFKGEYEKYAFSQLMLPENSAQQRLNLYAEGIDKITVNPDLPQLFRDIFRGAYVPYRDPETLNMFLKEIAEFSYSDSEDLGNAFEYLLSIMGSQGDAGQFRTPRHIINMMVELTAPQKNESILDPACGTAGFLISAFKYIEAHNCDKDGNSTLTADDKNRMVANFAGYDISPDMVRLSRVNMYLHGFTKPPISEYDTLTSLEKWDDTYDVIFANPPFMTPKGGIIPHNRYQISAKRSEVLFVDYIAEHLNPTGRAAVIVPEGIVFQSAGAYKNLRKYLVEDGLLYAVISLPAGVFNPYSGVKTSILLMDKTLAKERDNILFVNLNNDGYDLGAQRREIKGSEIPDVINVIQDYQKSLNVESRQNTIIAKKADVAAQDYILVGERYRTAAPLDRQYPMVCLGDTRYFDIESGGTPSSTVEEYWNGSINWATLADIPAENPITYLTHTQRQITEFGLAKSSAKLLPADTILVSTRATIGRIAIAQCEIATNQGFKNIIIKNKSKVHPIYVAYMVSHLVPRMMALASGGTFKEISKTNFSTLEIPLPPLSVQEQIVAEIEGYQKIIDGAKQVVDNYKPTIKIDPAWEMVKLGDMCENLDRRRVPITSSDRPKGIYPYYGASGIVDYVDNYIFDERLLLLSEDGANLVARVTPIAFSVEGKIWINNHAHALRFKDYSTQRYVEYYINQLDISNYVTGAAQPKLSQANMNKICIPLPPIETQREIVTRISEEMAIVEQNKRLIEIFRQKVSDKIADVWGE